MYDLLYNNGTKNMALNKGKNNEEIFMFGQTRRDMITYSLQFFAIFAGSFALLYVFGLIPDAFIPNRTAQVATNNAPSAMESGQQVRYDPQVSEDRNTATSNTVPTRVIIGKIGVDSTIQHPQSQDVDVLDTALTKGAVYYPGSGTIENGNIFLFGHSTNWQIVQNEAYKTFNGLEKLVAGDVITIWGDDGEIYQYAVEKVSLVDENSALVNFNTADNRLTISTCNTFGAKEERWVVEAVLQS